MVALMPIIHSTKTNVVDVVDDGTMTMMMFCVVDEMEMVMMRLVKTTPIISSAIKLTVV